MASESGLRERSATLGGEVQAGCGVQCVTLEGEAGKEDWLPASRQGLDGAWVLGSPCPVSKEAGKGCVAQGGHL